MAYMQNQFSIVSGQSFMNPIEWTIKQCCNSRMSQQEKKLVSIESW